MSRWIHWSDGLAAKQSLPSISLFLTLCLESYWKISSTEVTQKIIQIKTLMLKNKLVFSQFFPVILTDRGTEFSDVFSIENDLGGQLETKLFFCDPYQSSQKPFVEKNHSLFRNIVPKGTSFDDFTQDTLNLIFSHINSTSRKILNSKTPFEMFCFMHSKTFPNLFDIRYIYPQDVIQSKILLKK